MRQNRARDAAPTPRAAWLARQGPPPNPATPPLPAAPWSRWTLRPNSSAAQPTRDAAPTRRFRSLTRRHRNRPTSGGRRARRPASRQEGARLCLNLQTIVLIVVIVIALVVGGLAGGELYARHRADTILIEVAECVVEDGVTISFGVNPPFLWQHITGHYTNISVTTDGDRVQSADGMTAEVTLKDVRLQDSADSKGTIGSLNATLSWKSAGIKDTVAANLPGVGSSSPV